MPWPQTPGRPFFVSPMDRTSLTSAKDRSGTPVGSQGMSQLVGSSYTSRWEEVILGKPQNDYELEQLVPISFRLQNSQSTPLGNVKKTWCDLPRLATSSCLGLGQEHATTALLSSTVGLVENI